MSATSAIDIVQTVQRYHPDWEPPEDNGRTWQRVLCAFHDEDRPSAAISYRLNAYNCLACGVKGNSLSLIMQQEGVTYSEAIKLAQGIPAGSGGAVPPSPPRQPGRRVFGEARADVPQRARPGSAVPARVRGRASPWS